MIKFKVDGLSAEEIHDRHTALSESAVRVRVHKIMQHLQAAALALGTKTGDSNQRRRPNLADPTEKTLAAMKQFSLKHSADFLPISKSRRQLSLDSLLTSREGQ